MLLLRSSSVVSRHPQSAILEPLGYRNTFFTHIVFEIISLELTAHRQTGQGSNNAIAGMQVSVCG